MTGKLMMRGSSGKYDYLVVARNGAVGLGIKPYAQQSYLQGVPVVFFGFNMRSAKHPEAEGELINAHILKEAWPTAKFQKVDEDRCSVMIMGPATGKPRTPELNESFTERGVMEHLVEFVQKTAGEFITAEGAEIHEFLYEHYKNGLEVPEPANVISFADYLAKSQTGEVEEVETAPIEDAHDDDDTGTGDDC